MLVVSDSSTLILLARSDLLDPSIKYFAGIMIPKAVEKEVVEEGIEYGYEDAMLVRDRIREGKIKVVDSPAKNVGVLRKDYGIHVGEAEALALYLHLKADLLGVDDGKAIKICKILQVKFFTALSLLIYFAQEGILSKKQAMNCTQTLAKHGRYAKQDLELAFDEIGGEVK